MTAHEGRRSGRIAANAEVRAEKSKMNDDSVPEINLLANLATTAGNPGDTGPPANLLSH